MNTLLIILYLVFSGFILTAFVSSAIFWYETRNSVCPEIPLPTLTPLSFIKVYLLILGSYFIGAAVHPFGWIREFRRKNIQANPETDATLKNPPLLLIHGIHDNSIVWLYLESVFRKAGYPAYTMSYSSFGANEQKIVSDIEQQLDIIHQKHHGEKVILVGHSLGGLLIRLLMQNMENMPKTEAILTICTPHNGSKMAVFAPGQLAKILYPKSDFIKQLNASPDLPLPCTAIITPGDEAVHPSCSLLPPKGWNLRITHLVSHLGILFCPRAAKIILEELKKLQIN